MMSPWRLDWKEVLPHDTHMDPISDHVRKQVLKNSKFDSLFLKEPSDSVSTSFKIATEDPHSLCSCFFYFILMNTEHWPAAHLGFCVCLPNSDVLSTIFMVNSKTTINFWLKLPFCMSLSRSAERTLFLLESGYNQLHTDPIQSYQILDTYPTTPYSFPSKQTPRFQI